MTLESGNFVTNFLDFLFEYLNSIFHADNVSGGRDTRLLVGRCLNFDFGRGIAKLALELIPGLLEFPQALAKTTGEFGKLFCAEEQHHNDKNEDSFRPAGHAEGNWEIH